MGQALYRKYRSRKLNEIVGQKAVTTALENALKSGQLSHAYLFTGPRGVGKTSIARILAHEINQLPYESDELPIDIIEIDAASNRRIDEIRDLREKVRIAPVSATYKVYIIDEVHMLTREAFNALLKTLEEPPAHVIFILATTESHKLPETIVSRTQRYTFKLATQDEVAAHLKTIAEKEKISIDDDALQLLAKHSGGSLRDALSLLDQIRHTGGEKITAALVRQNLGLPSETFVATIMAAVISGDITTIMTSLDSARSNGLSSSLIAEELLQALRSELATNTNTLPTNETILFMEALLAVEASARPDIQLELALVGAQLHRMNLEHPVVSEAHIVATQAPLTISKPVSRPPSKKVEPAATSNTPVSTPEPTVTTSTPVDATTDSVVLASEQWTEALGKLKQTHNTLYSIVRMAKPDYSNTDSKQFTLLFRFPFHQKRMNESKNKQVIVNTLASVGVTGYEITCGLMAKNETEEVNEVALEPFVYEAPAEQDNALLNQIRTVFGGAEVLE